MNHTKEPWEYGQFSDTLRVKTEDEEIARLSLRYYGLDNKAHANAKRIVACVNACADVEDKKLKLGYVKKLEKENAELRKVLLQNGYNAKLREDV